MASNFNSQVWIFTSLTHFQTLYLGTHCKKENFDETIEGFKIKSPFQDIKNILRCDGCLDTRVLVNPDR